MIFTRRFFALALLGAVPTALSALAPAFAFAAVAWNLALCALVLIDWLRCPRPEIALQAARSAGAGLSVTTPNEVRLQVRNVTDRPLRVQVRDEPPGTFALTRGAREASLTLAAREEAMLDYTLVPPVRGDFAFGDIYLRVCGPLGLAVRQGTIPASAGVAVYPNIQAIGAYDLNLRRAQRARPGQRRTRLHGAGREFSSLRDYTPDDEFRAVDWKATARRARVTSRTFAAERSQDVLLLLDQGRLMRQEIGHTQTMDHVVHAALMLAHVVAQADDRVGLLAFAAAPRLWLAPRRGRAQAHRILQALHATRAEPAESDYRAAFRHLAARWRKRSLAVLFTDVADPESSAMLLQEIAHLARAHLVVCVTVRDPLVAARARQVPGTAEKAFEKAVAGQVLAQRNRALALLQKRGVLVVDAEPETLSAELVTRYLSVKRRALL